MALLVDGARLALGEIGGQVGGVRLARTVLIEQARESLERGPVLNLMGAPGVGKSSVLKHLAELVQPEGRIIILRNGRIVPGGWLRMAHELGCTVSSDWFFNERSGRRCHPVRRQYRPDRRRQRTRYRDRPLGRSREISRLARDRHQQ
ncbi:MAG: ATP-binding cassette domain-containing protein [Mesorhizobium sp.]|nr:MAG: ATP-binding cassette domain-containing protein [Mesorhizobium sp.]